MAKIGFDNEKYLKLQSEKIRERILHFGGKLYLEFGGKLFDDHHASRALPGFQPDSKLRMLLELKEQAEIVIVINSEDIEKNKVRGDLGITYDLDVLRLIDVFRGYGLYVGSVVLSRYNSQSAATVNFQKKLENMGIKTYRHYTIEGYPSDVAKIVSQEGFGRNDYICTERSLVVVTAPGPGSGKMATCLSQLYHEHIRGVNAGYAKFETFPIWNLPLKHAVNIAYEAATADLNDVNMIDPFHLEAYEKTAVNYNRDVEIFPVLDATFKEILGTSPYRSPTDMGVNMAGFCIFDDDAVVEASRNEVIRRYYSAMCNKRKGAANEEEVYKIELLMKQAGISVNDRKCVKPALELAAQTGEPAAAIELPDGRIITGKTTTLMGAASAMLLNTLKSFGGIDMTYHMISPVIIEPIQTLKTKHFGSGNPRLHTDEVLVALSICAPSDSIAKRAFDQLPKLKGCEMHSSVILSSVDEDVLRRLGINLTCEPRYETAKLFHGKD